MLRIARVFHLLFSLWLAAMLPLAVWAQQAQSSQAPEKEGPLTQGLPQREVGKKERERREKKLRQELETHFNRWLEEDVVYIILPEEKDAFLHLSTDEEREQFIEQFWLRRDPTPDTIENEHKEEHYRRIAYANERFASGVPGWTTDRGLIYIIHGPPDETEAYPAGGMYDRLPEEGGGGTVVHPFERWRYRYLDGIGNNIILEFVDPTGTGEYRLTMDPSEKDALTEIPGAGLSQLEQLGLASKVERFKRSDGTRLPRALSQTAAMEPFERLSLFAAVQKPPPVKFKDLETLVETRISFHLLPFDVRLDFLRLTNETILVPITIALEKKNLTFAVKEGLQQSVVNIFGRLSTLTGRIVESFEDVISLDLPPSLLASTLGEPAIYQKLLPLRPGLYKLNLVLKDVNSGNIGTVEQRLAVPRFEEGQLAHSSLILADLIERVPSKSAGRGQFVIGDTKVRPLVGEQFRQNDRVGIYLQVYNLAVDEKTHRPNATIDYTVLRGEEVLFHRRETTAQLSYAGQQITLEKVLGLGNLQPGQYKLSILVTDRIRNAMITPTAHFRILP